MILQPRPVRLLSDGRCALSARKHRGCVADVAHLGSIGNSRRLNPVALPHAAVCALRLRGGRFFVFWLRRPRIRSEEISVPGFITPDHLVLHTLPILAEFDR